MSNKFTRFSIQEILMDAGLDTHQARKATDKIIRALSDSLAEGEPVELRGLGSFEYRERKSYKAHNPKTKEAVMTKPRRRIIFRPERELKDNLAEL
ncbi:MAG: integration host factor subunit beta [Treponema sp.]|nr:integration host factor subunit beta [Treponema sp.]